MNCKSTTLTTITVLRHLYLLALSFIIAGSNTIYALKIIIIIDFFYWWIVLFLVLSQKLRIQFRRYELKKKESRLERFRRSSIHPAVKAILGLFIIIAIAHHVFFDWLIHWFKVIIFSIFNIFQDSAAWIVKRMPVLHTPIHDIGSALELSLLHTFPIFALVFIILSVV